MKEEKPKILNLQYSSLLDSTVFKTVSRVTDQLRNLYYSSEVNFDTLQTIGDIIPIIKSKNKVIELEYEVLNESDVESVINRVNFDIFGDSLVEIPNPEFNYVIKIVSYIDSQVDTDQNDKV
jgi:hypothetical protein